MTKMVLPTRVKFLLCDDVRAESSGKLTLIGLYPDDKILVQQNPALTNQPGWPAGMVAVLNQLAIVCVAFGGDGTFPASATITGPSGVPLSTMPLGTAIFQPNTPATMALQGGLFPVAQYGQFKCTLTIGKSSFHYTFDVIAAPVPSPAAVPKATKKRPKRKP
jgi:hypothetical protein